MKDGWYRVGGPNYAGEMVYFFAEVIDDMWDYNYTDYWLAKGYTFEPAVVMTVKEYHAAMEYAHKAGRDGFPLGVG